MTKAFAAVSDSGSETDMARQTETHWKRARDRLAAQGKVLAPIADFSNALCDCERGHNGIGLAGRECDCTPDAREQDDLAECFHHHIVTTIGWPAFGARPSAEMQMYEDGFKAGYRRCKSDNEPELGG